MKKSIKTMLAFAAALVCGGAWAAVGDTVTISNINTGSSRSVSNFNGDTYTICIPASVTLPSGSVVKVTKITLGMNSSSDADKLPKYLKIGESFSAMANGTGSQNTSSTFATNSLKQEYSFADSDLELTVGTEYALSMCSDTNGTIKNPTRWHVEQTTDGTYSLIKQSSSSTSYRIDQEFVGVVQSISGPTPTFSFTGNASGGSVSGFTVGGEGGDAARKIMGPAGTQMPMIYHVNDNNKWIPWADFTAKSTFTLAAYVNTSACKPTDGKNAVIWSMGSKSGNRVMLVKSSDGKIKLITASGANISKESTAPAFDETAGYHLYTASFSTTGGLKLTVDADTANAKTDSTATTQAANGFQIGSMYQGLQTDKFEVGTNIGVANLIGYDVVLSDEQITSLSSIYPAVSMIKTDIHQDTANKEVVVPSATTDGNHFIGVSKGTMTIPAGATVSVPHVRCLNNDATGDRGTFNVAGTLNVTSESSNANVWEDRLSYKGVLFGHYHGQGTYNITGTLSAPQTFVELCYTAEAQTLNVNGGAVTTKGIYSNNGKGTVNLSNNGRITLSTSTFMNVPVTVTGGTIAAGETATYAKRLTVSSGNLALDVASGKTLTMNGGVSNSGTITKTGAGALKLTGTLSALNGALAIEEGSVEISNASELTIGTVLSGSGAFTKTGAGALTLTGLNTHAGSTTISEGTLVANRPSGSYSVGESSVFKSPQDISEGGDFVKPTIVANEGSVQLQVTISRADVLAERKVAVADLADTIESTENFAVTVINADTGNAVESVVTIENHVLCVTPQGAKQTLTYTPTQSGDFSWTTGATVGNQNYRDYDDISFATTEYTTTVSVPSKIAATALNVGGIYNFSGKPIIASTLGTLEGANATFDNDVVADTITVNEGTVKGESFVASNVSVEGATFGAKVVGPSMRYVRLKVTATQGNGATPAVGEFRLYRGSAATGYTIVDWPIGTKVTESTGLVATKETEAYPGEVGAGLGNQGGNESQPGCLIDGYYGDKSSPTIYGSGNYHDPAHNKWWPTSQASGPWTVTIEFPYPVAMFSGCNFCLADHGPRNPTAWTIEVSNDGTYWTEVNNTTGATWSGQYAWAGGDENTPAFLNTATTPTTVSVGNGSTILADGNWTATLNVSGNVTLKGVAERHLTLDAASTSTFAESAALTFDLSDYSVTKAGKQYVVAGPLDDWPAVENITITPADLFTLSKDTNGYYVEVMSGSYWLGGAGNWNLATDAMWAEDATSEIGLIWLNGAEAKFTRNATVTVASGVEASGVTLSEGVQVTMSGTLPTIGASGTMIGQNAKLTIGGTTAWSGTVTNNGVIRYSDLSGSVAAATYLATAGKVELGSVTVTGGHATSTLNVPTGDEITLSSNDNYIPVNVCGGEVTFNNGDSRVWNDAAFTMTDGHATVTTTTTAQNGNSSGFLLGVYNGVTMNISGGIFEIPNSSINFWGGSTASGINLSGTGVFKAKGGFNGNLTGNVTIADTARLEVGSLGWTATAANVTLNGGTLKGYEDNASIASPITVAQASKISAASDTTLTVTSTITGSGALTIGDATDNGTVNLSGATMSGYTGTLSFSGSSVVLPSDFGGTVNGAEAKIVGESSTTYYSTVSAAITAATGDGLTVTLLANVTDDTASITIPAGVTLDIGSHSYLGTVVLSGAIAGNGVIGDLIALDNATVIMPATGCITVRGYASFGMRRIRVKNAPAELSTYMIVGMIYFDETTTYEPYAVTIVNEDNSETVGVALSAQTESSTFAMQTKAAVTGVRVQLSEDDFLIMGYETVAYALQIALANGRTCEDVFVYDMGAQIPEDYCVVDGHLATWGFKAANTGDSGSWTIPLPSNADIKTSTSTKTRTMANDPIKYTRSGTYTGSSKDLVITTLVDLKALPQDTQNAAVVSAHYNTDPWAATVYYTSDKKLILTYDEFRNDYGCQVTSEAYEGLHLITFVLKPDKTMLYIDGKKVLTNTTTKCVEFSGDANKNLVVFGSYAKETGWYKLSGSIFYSCDVQIMDHSTTEYEDETIEDEENVSEDIKNVPVAYDAMTLVDKVKLVNAFRNDNGTVSIPGAYSVDGGAVITDPAQIRELASLIGNNDCSTAVNFAMPFVAPEQTDDGNTMKVAIDLSHNVTGNVMLCVGTSPDGANTVVDTKSNPTSGVQTFTLNSISTQMGEGKVLYFKVKAAPAQ